MKLYNYFRSSASYRVRIVASLKGLSYEYVSINLMRGESRTPAYEALNPQGRVPALEDNGRMLAQSLAICEYLEETHPNPPLLPSDPAGRATRPYVESARSAPSSRRSTAPGLSDSRMPSSKIVGAQRCETPPSQPGDTDGTV
jgi:glutathione S-transferase